MSAALLTPDFRPAPSVMDDLRSQIAKIERAGTVSRSARSETTITVGTPDIDAALPWGGLPVCGLHEVFGDAAAIGYATSLLRRLAALHPTKPILWCQPSRDLHGQGLAAFGLDPARLILVHGRTDTDILWAMEEGLATTGLAGVVGVMHKLPPIAARRLQLAAEEHGSFGLLLRPLDPMAGNRAAAEMSGTSMALTRWRVSSAPSLPDCFGSEMIGMGAARWRLELQRCRLSASHPTSTKLAGHPRAWQVEWHDETGDLSMVAPLRDGSVEPGFVQRAAS